MHESAFQINDIFTFILYFSELTAASLCFANGLRRKEAFRKHLGACFFLAFTVSGILSVFLHQAGLRKSLPPSLCIYTLLTLLAILTVFLCYSGPVWDRLFCCLCGLICQMAVKKSALLLRVIVELCGLDAGLLAKGQPLYYIVYYAILIATYSLVYRNFRLLFSSRQAMLFNSKIFITFAGTNIIFLLLNIIEPVMLRYHPGYYPLVLLCEIIYCVMILCMQFFLLQLIQARIESNTLKEIWKTNRQQYELTKENIDIINIKCHDIRHQLRNAELTGRVPEQFVSQLEQSISIYDSTIRTGNEILDVILTDKALRCQAENIQLTCVADGKKLDFMEQSDLISLFSNALENATEYVSTIPDPEKRYINLLVRQQSGFLTIQVENYYEGAPVAKNENPSTSKPDAIQHGYGIRSMRYIARKYSGSLDIYTGRNLFRLNLLFPLSEHIS